MTASRVEPTHFRAFGIRLVDRFVDKLRAEHYPSLEFPNMCFNVDELWSHGTTTTPKHWVTAEARCAYSGTSVEITAFLGETGRLSLRTDFTATLFIHGAREKWRGTAVEEENGVVTLGSIYQTEAPERGH